MKAVLNTDVLVTAMTAYYTDKRLQAVIIGKMVGLQQEGNDNLEQLSYFQDLQTRILKLCKGKTANITDPMRNLLLEMNFNTRGFIGYCKSDIEKTLEGHCTEDEKLEYLYSLERKFKTLICKKKGIRFDPQLPKLKDAILKYVKAEVRFMKKKRSLFAAEPQQSAGLQCGHERLPLKISVDALAYFFRLLLTAGVVSATKGRLLEFLSRSFATPGTGQKGISMQSIEVKYRQVVRSTAMTVRTVLVKMMKSIDEEYG